MQTGLGEGGVCCGCIVSDCFDYESAAKFFNRYKGRCPNLESLYHSDAMGSRRLAFAVIGLSTVAALLLVILLPLSFSYLNPTQLGLAQTRATGSVSTDRAYSFGRHWLGVTKTFYVFPASAQQVTQTAAGISYTFFYVLQPARLPDLYRQFGRGFDSVVRARAAAAVQALDPVVGANRSEVQQAVHAAVRAQVEDATFVTVPLLFLGASTASVSPGSLQAALDAANVTDAATRTQLERIYSLRDARLHVKA